LLPAYLVVGEDMLKRETVLKRLKARVAGSGDLSLNYDLFQGTSAAAHDIVSACITLPFVGDTRLVQVADADKLKKADADALAEYLKSPSESTVLALVAEKLPDKSRLYQAVRAFGEKAVISCLPQKRYELVKTLRSIARGHGMTLTEGAASALIDLVGENTVHLDGELRKIALARQGSPAIDEEAVRALVSRTTAAKPWEFVDAFSARRVDACVRYLRQGKPDTPYVLLGRCVVRLRELVCAKSLDERGSPAALGAVLKAPDWKVKNHLAWSRGFTAEELRRSLVSARDTERAMKSGADPDAAFLEWILSVTAR